MKFMAGWKMTISVAILLPILISLGFWQLNRAEEKHQLLAAQQALQSAEPVRISGDSLLNYQPVSLVGHYDSEHYFLLDNQVVLGKVGFDVISPFYDASGRVVWLNRGWLEAGQDRSELPVVSTPLGHVAVSGSVGRNLSKPFLLAPQNISGDWPVLIQAVDLGLMSARLDVEPMDFFVRIDAGNPGAFTTHYQAVNVLPVKHTAYAVQWFSMAFALVCLFVYFGFNRGKRNSKG